jgi:RND superfamily putative drug exporter
MNNPGKNHKADPPSEQGFLARLARQVIAHRRAVLVFWLIVFLAGGVAASQVSKRLSYNFAIPGQPAYVTSKVILRHFGNGGQTAPAIVVVSVPGRESISATHPPAAITRAFADVRRALPDLRVVGLGVSEDPAFVTDGGHSTYAYLFTPPPTGLSPPVQARQAEAIVARALPGDHVALTGESQLQAGGSHGGPGVLIETIIGGLGALAVLAFVFASFLAVMPMMVAATAILTTFVVLLGLSYVTQISFVVEFLVSLVGLGVAIDYSLLIVTRWREERAKGATNDDAIVAAITKAGRAVALSGITVAIGLLSLIVLPVPLLRSTGIGGMLIPLISVAVVLTLLPALLARIGPRLDWPHVRRETSASSFWRRWASAVVRRPWLAVAAAVVILGVATLPVFGIEVGQSRAAAQASQGQAHAAYTAIVRGGASPGVLTPIEVVTTAAGASSTVARLGSVRGVVTATVPSGTSGTSRGLSDIVVIPNVETLNSASFAPVEAIEAATAHDRQVIGVAGLGAFDLDSARAIYDGAPLMIALIALLTFLLLSRAFRSVLLAAKAVVLNLVSLGATFGILTWFWQSGHGSMFVFGIPATGAITFWIPISIFAFLFGLSMDYEVFILVRMREEYDASGSTTAAVVEGLGRTGRLVTSAALILFLAFASLASAPLTDIKVLATGLGIGILLDATVVRALFVPALVTLFGRANWWMPRPLGRVLRVDRNLVRA